jgi:3-hydroxyisobutyrate dehydrogenase
MEIAVLGTGRLGAAIAERLQVCGNQVLAWNRTSEKAVALRPLGVTVTANPVDAIQEAKVVLTVLADADATRRVLLSPAAGPVLADRTVVQMGTISPEESRGLSKAIQSHGGRYLEAPVLGSLAEARSGTLLVMVGGTADSFDRWSPLFHHLSRKPQLVGPVGHAAALKLAFNQLIAAEIAAFSLSLGLVQRAGIPVDTFMTTLKASALFAATFEKKLPRLLGRDYADPNFSTEHLLKDVNLVLREAQLLGLETSTLTGLRPLLERTISSGYGPSDYSAIFETINPPSSTL